MQSVGRYQIKAALGEGAMADVYRAHDPGVGRDVAIKILKPEYRANADIVGRFLRESRAAGMLSHANIATIYDVGEADGFPYIAMEFVDGRPLDEIIAEQGRMPVERALDIARQLADALAYAHRQGIVHRDIKPSNILMCEGGRTAKLLDFGIARIADGDDMHDADQACRTQVGQVVGTPRYMSPEQALGLPVDQRSDLFSLGVVLYELLTGKTAFDATGVGTLAIQIAQQQPAPIERTVRDCPKGVRYIVDKLLAKKPEERYADGDALGDAIGREIEALTGEDGERRRGLALRFKLPLILCATTAIALAFCVVAVLNRQTRTMENMALASGSSITAFVTSNAALYAAENAGLPPEQQDWMPLQAFVASAAGDANVRRIVVVDDRGIVRAAGDKSLIGNPYRQPAGEPHVDFKGKANITESTGSRGDGYRFVEPIEYAGANFGKVDLVIGRQALDSAIASARNLLIGLSIIVMGVVFAIGYMSARIIARPIRRLRRALDDAAKGRLGFRISHRRRDELGQLFDSFNHMAATLEPQLVAPAEDPAALARTRVDNPVHKQLDRIRSQHAA
ncbi:protein kinase domain-containing protein [Stakelama marina]|uniref:non-specific serine/threonine protein kinase n=1 Tax=Stakelama marina TaxID=2826939 RepID=A0A8T4IH13_9SPHN|nr:protein kinase [Stakelama marina]MBR0553322.1 protein kinase [Stakelama marina]